MFTLCVIANDWRGDNDSFRKISYRLQKNSVTRFGDFSEFGYFLCKIVTKMLVLKISRNSETLAKNKFMRIAIRV